MRIQVDASLTRDHAREILLHELLHALDDDNHLKMGEKRVDRLARYLLQALRGNPQLRKFILEDDPRANRR